MLLGTFIAIRYFWDLSFCLFWELNFHGIRHMSEVIEAVHNPSYKELQRFVKMPELQFLNTWELTSFEVGTALNGKGLSAWWVSHSEVSDRRLKKVCRNTIFAKIRSPSSNTTRLKTYIYWGSLWGPICYSAIKLFCNKTVWYITTPYISFHIYICRVG